MHAAAATLANRDGEARRASDTPVKAFCGARPSGIPGQAAKCKSLPVVADRDQQKSQRTASGVTRWPVKDLRNN